VTLNKEEAKDLFHPSLEQLGLGHLHFLASEQIQHKQKSKKQINGP